MFKTEQEEKRRKQEVLNFIENQIIREQEESRRDIDLFEVRSGIKDFQKPKYDSQILESLKELDRLGIRREKPPDFEFTVYDIEKSKSKQTKNPQNQASLRPSSAISSSSAYSGFSSFSATSAISEYIQ
ncbi:MAG: hypothetical protein EZS28_009193 [Streblomastix strix]|uniref:Uncharacterized protein n=1 Tax=Streblomastix strix TaxID=222440 RepID=A0A5J4WL48_9EUKA|nr:MAG: hypothetical protein EZS28_009193 [Streblomastix strix]